MRSSFFIFTAIFCLASAAPSTSQKGKYIIKLKPQVNQVRLLNFINQANNGLEADQKVGKVKTRYNPSFFNGFAGEFNDAFLEDLKRQHANEIEYVEVDHIVRINKIQKNAPWGLSRISKTKRSTTNKDYEYLDSAGNSVTVYVVDTGVEKDHPEFEGRASLGASFVDGETDDASDHNGHGTHCAGTIAGKTYGVAKKAKVVGVRVLDADGSGSYSGVISGIQWVSNQTSTAPNGIKIMSMSLGGPKSEAVNDAIDQAALLNVAPIVAAGNDGSDACDVSPASATSAFAVGAIDNKDKMASFSNNGKCVGVYAPGVGILSASLNKGTETLDGTSMACPHVAGTAALYMAEYKYKTVKDLLKSLKDNASAASGSSTIKVVYTKAKTRKGTE